jgi:hypothetical protein
LSAPILNKSMAEVVVDLELLRKEVRATYRKFAKDLT